MNIKISHLRQILQKSTRNFMEEDWYLKMMLDLGVWRQLGAVIETLFEK